MKNFGLVVHKKNKGLAQKRNSKGKMTIKPTQQSLRNSGIKKKKFDLRKKPNQEKDMSKIQCFNCRKYGHYKNHCPELNKRKETHEESFFKEREPSKKAKYDKTNFFF